jgi:ribosomal protection tetracycline resistance protein
MARTTSADFRYLTPVVISQAVERAGTRVCEPIVRLRVESPSEYIGDLLHAIAQLAGSIEDTRVQGELLTVEARMPAERLREFQKKLPGLSGGEGSFESVFDGYQPVVGKPPRRSPDVRSRST